MINKKVTENIKFLVGFKYILIFGFFALMITTAVYFKNVFIFLSNYHIFEILIIGIIIFTIWCLYRLFKILNYSKKEIILAITIVIVAWVFLWWVL